MYVRSEDLFYESDGVVPTQNLHQRPQNEVFQWSVKDLKFEILLILQMINIFSTSII